MDSNNSSKDSPPDEIIASLTPKILYNYEFDNIVQGFYVMGPDPLDLKSKPKILYSCPSNCPEDILLSYCFPSEANDTSILNDPEKFIQHTITEPIQREMQFFVIYCPYAKFAPYFFCCKYRANLFNMPTFSHNLSFDQMFEYSQLTNLPTFDICLAIRVHQPNHDLFLGLLEWILRCESFGRAQAITTFMENYSNIKDYESTKKQFPVSDAWPEEHRKSMFTLINKLFRTKFTQSTENFDFSHESFPKLQWSRQYFGRQNYQLTVFSLNGVLKILSIDTFLTFLTSLLLEKRIIISSSNITSVSLIILAANLMIYPLKLSVPTFSVIPISKFEKLKEKKSFVVGITEELTDIPDDCLYINVHGEESSMKSSFSEEIPKLPEIEKIKQNLEDNLWFDADKKRNVACAQLLDFLTGYIRGILMPVEDCFDENFDFELETFESFFMEESKPFIDSLIKTKIFKNYVDYMKNIQSSCF